MSASAAWRLLLRVQLDSKGTHARSCAVGGWLVRRHNELVSVLRRWCEKRCGCVVHIEQVLPTASDGHTLSRMDLIVHSPLLPTPLFIDLTVVSAVSREALARGSASNDGVASEIAAARKVKKYPGCEVHAFPIEDHGRLGEAARTAIRMLAPRDPVIRSQAIADLYQDLACVAQRMSADAVIAAAAGQSRDFSSVAA